VVVLAAGASRRLPGPKQLLKYHGTTLLRRAAETAVAAACGPVVVVLGAAAEKLRPELVGLDVRIVENRRAAEGLSTSIRAGLDALGEGASVDAALFMTCDQPLLTAEVLKRIAAAFAAGRSPAVACEYAGTIGVPALLDRSLFAELQALDGDQGAKRVLRRHTKEVVRVPFEAGSVDVDSPEDWSTLR
jgi:molybdenum cofactor cytidylyltransferase